MEVKRIRSKIVGGKKIEKVQINDKTYNCSHFPASYFKNVEFIYEICKQKEKKLTANQFLKRLPLKVERKEEKINL
jgi:hypothetical protein